jgi:hypothetical protein
MSIPHMSLTSNPTPAIQPLQTPVSSYITKDLLFSKTESTIIALNVNAVTSLVEGLRIADKTSEVDGQVSDYLSLTL